MRTVAVLLIVPAGPGGPAIVRMKVGDARPSTRAVERLFDAGAGGGVLVIVFGRPLGQRAIAGKLTAGSSPNGVWFPVSCIVHAGLPTRR
jgi:hypothetical protein